MPKKKSLSWKEIVAAIFHYDKKANHYRISQENTQKADQKHRKDIGSKIALIYFNFQGILVFYYVFRPTQPG